MYKVIFILFLELLALGKLDSASVSGNAEVSGSIPPLISFKDGNVGVNFLGFRASAGLGGLLTGNAAHGGLHAEAGTPFGQSAGAGLGGNVDGQGRSVGGLYAGATAGGGISAGAGLSGQAGADGTVSQSYAGSSGIYASKTKISTASHPAAAAVHVEKISAPIIDVNKHFEITAAASPAVDNHVKVAEHAKPQTTYVEKTVIPNYVEKTIFVPSYVEKTIRVPTVVEKKVKVEAPPTVIEKTVAAPPAGVNFDVSAEAEKPVPGPVTVVHKTKVLRTRPHRLHFRKHFNYLGSGGYGDNYGAGYYGAGNFGNNYGGASTITVQKSANTRLLNDIFNIPIATLGAVNKLVSGIGGGTSGSFSVSKSVGVGNSAY